MGTGYRSARRIFLLFAMPILFQFLAQSDLLNLLFVRLRLPGELVAPFREISLFFGILLTFLPLGTSCIRQAFQAQIQKEQQEYLVRQFKSYLLEAFRGLLPDAGPEISLNVRMCTPGKNRRILYRGKRNGSRGKSRFFVMHNLPGLSDASVRDGLTFQVFPEKAAQGAVGMCYVKKDRVVYEPNLKAPPEERLGSCLKEQTQDIALWICVPVHNAKGEICAIMSFDSGRALPVPADKLGILSSLLKKFSVDYVKNMTNLIR